MSTPESDTPQPKPRGPGRPLQGSEKLKAVTTSLRADQVTSLARVSAQTGIPAALLVRRGVDRELTVHKRRASLMKLPPPQHPDRR